MSITFLKIQSLLAMGASSTSVRIGDASLGVEANLVLCGDGDIRDDECRSADEEDLPVSDRELLLQNDRRRKEKDSEESDLTLAKLHVSD
jgi:hypothetical protein